MAKRTRGSQRSRRRPGVRPTQSPTERRPGYPSAVSPSAFDVLSEEPIELTEPGAATEPAAAPVRQTPTTHIRHKVKAGSLLAARAATEYVYVGRDMRQILFVAVALFGSLIILWLLVVVWRLVPLSFY